MEAIVGDMDSGQLKAVAAELEISREALYQMANPNIPEKRFNLRHAVVVARISRGDTRLCEFFAAQAGLRVVILPDAEVGRDGLDASIKEVIESGKDLVGAHIDARDPAGPGGSDLTKDEWRRNLEKTSAHLKSVAAHQDRLINTETVED